MKVLWRITAVECTGCSISIYRGTTRLPMANSSQVCDVCGLPFDSEEELQEHAKVAHGQQD